MKKIILIIFIFIFSYFVLPKINIIAFPGGGYSLLPESEYMIGYMNKNGMVNWERLNWLLQNIANAGASGWREFPYWPTQDQDFLKSISPFRVKSEKVIWNDLYFDNLGKIFRFAYEQYNLLTIFDLFNASETRVKGAKKYSPWKTFDNFFYDPDSKQTRHEWITRVIAAAGDIPVMYQIMNEPPTKAVKCTIDTYLFLIEKGIPPERILIGWDVYKKKKEPVYRKAYNRWRDAVIASLEKMPQYKDVNVGLKIIKGTSWSPIHGMHHDSVRDYFQHGVKTGQEVPSGSSRNTIYSTDAVNPRLDFIGGSNLAISIIQVKPGAINAGRIWLEYVVGKETKVKDPFGQLKGGVAAITEKYGFPQNKNKFPTSLPIPTWVYENPAQIIPPTDPDPDGKPKVQEEEKKEKNKTLYYIIGTAITCILTYFFINHTLVTGIVLGLLLLAGSYYLNKKKKKLWYIPTGIAVIGWVIFGLFSNPIFTLSIVSILSVSVNVLQFKGKIKKF